jgi:UDP-N-acetylglucosamine diphosphorylase/glucosamine-1-phosphate N-acetyltransferase
MSGNQKKFILFDDQTRDHLLPFTFIRPVSEIRIGILTIREKWEKWTGEEFSYFTQEYLRKKFPMVIGEENILINGSVTPNRDLVDEIAALACGEVLMKDNLLVAGCFDRSLLDNSGLIIPDTYSRRQVKANFLRISRPWHIFQLNKEELASDFCMITAGRRSIPLSQTNNLIHPEQVFVEEGAQLEYATINASPGPVYIGKNTTIMEGALIRGSFALCEGAIIKMGAKIYGPTTVGPFSRAGGEITNSVFFSYSNKVHEGYVGNSVIGDWCNIGANSNTSNLKNNYSLVKLWSYVTGKVEDTGMQFCGLFMGDYSKCGISTMFNTGTVVGVFSNIYGAGYPGNFIPSFSWGGAAGFETYRLSKAFETIEKGMTHRNMKLSEIDKQIINHIFILTNRYRESR